MTVAANMDVGILVYQALSYLQHTLEHLEAHYPDRHLILVNDCDRTTDSFCEQYAMAHAETDYVRRPQRGWFTRAANTALATALARPEREWFILLNSDLEIFAGAFEEMLGCWKVVEEQGHKVGMVGSEGPCAPEHPRYTLKQEMGYLTAHAVLFNKQFMREHRFRFPQDPREMPGDPKGMTAQGLVHINSDRYLSYWMNRCGFATIASHHSGIGHFGGRSWGFRLADIPSERAVGP